MLKSSTVLKYIGQYIFLFCAIGWIGKSLYDILSGFFTDNWNPDEIILRLIVGLFHLAAFLYLRNKFVVVELGGQTVRILRGKETIETTWLNVESVSMLIFSGPPIYTMRIKDIKGYFIFWNSAMNLFWVDDSDLGILISQKKKQLDI